MRRKIFFACVALVVSAAAVVGVKAYNYYSMSPLMRANLAALTSGENNVQIPGYKNVTDKTHLKDIFDKTKFQNDKEPTNPNGLSLFNF